MELVTARDATSRVPQVTVRLIVRWRQMGLLEAFERATGPSLYRLDEIAKLASQPPRLNLATVQARNRLIREKRRSGTYCCTACGRDTQRRSRICSECTGER